MTDKKAAFFILLLLGMSWVALVAYIWSPQHYWPDADGYLLHVSERRWVAHPPGYALFVILGRAFYATGCSAYFSVQLASLSLTIAGLGVLYCLLREEVVPNLALLLTMAAAFSWVVLLNVQTGTSHASDLLTVSFLLLAAVRLPHSRISAFGADHLFAAALFLCAGFRINTLIMMAPLCMLIAWNNRLRPSFWVSCLSAMMCISVWQMWVIWQSGGFTAYLADAESMNACNATSSLLLSGLTKTTMLNVFRALLWASIGCLPFLIVILPKFSGRISGVTHIPLVYGLAAAIGALACTSLYLCTHPGLLVGIIPATALCAASLSSGAPERFPFKSFVVVAVGIVALFLLMSPFAPPVRKWQALANGILLQYSANCSRHAVFNTTARWFRLAGFESEIPVYRMIRLRQEDEWRKKFKKIRSEPVMP